MTNDAVQFSNAGIITVVLRLASAWFKPPDCFRYRTHIRFERRALI